MPAQEAYRRGGVIACILYIPFTVALAGLLFYSARGTRRGYGNGRLVPFALAVAAALFGSLYLVCVADRPWVAVGVPPSSRCRF